MGETISGDTKLTRDRAVEELKRRGYPVSKASLATLASRGGGPRYRVFGKRVLYEWSDLLEWAQGRCSAPRCSTSELDVAREARVRTNEMTKSAQEEARHPAGASDAQDRQEC